MSTGPTGNDCVLIVCSCSFVTITRRKPCLTTCPIPNHNASPRSLLRNRSGALAHAWSCDGRYMFVAERNALLVYRARIDTVELGFDLDLVQSFTEAAIVRVVSASRLGDGSYLVVTGSANGVTARCFDPEMPNGSASLFAHTQGLSAHRDGAAEGSGLGGADTANGIASAASAPSTTVSHLLHSFRICCSAFSPHGGSPRRLAISSSDGHFGVWHAGRTISSNASWRSHVVGASSRVTALSFCDGASLLAVGSWDGTVRVYRRIEIASKATANAVPALPKGAEQHATLPVPPSTSSEKEEAEKEAGKKKKSIAEGIQQDKDESWIPCLPCHATDSSLPTFPIPCPPSVAGREITADTAQSVRGPVTLCWLPSRKREGHRSASSSSSSSAHAGKVQSLVVCRDADAGATTAATGYVFALGNCQTGSREAEELVEKTEAALWRTCKSLRSKMQCIRGCVAVVEPKESDGHSNGSRARSSGDAEDATAGTDGATVVAAVDRDGRICISCVEGL